MPGDINQTPEEEISVLLVEDNEDDACLICLNIARQYKIQSVRVDTSEALKSALSQQSWDLALCDGRVLELDIDRALSLIRQADPELPVIVISGALAESRAVAMMDAGIRDFINKDELSRLNPAIRRELRDASIRRRQASILHDLEKSNKELQRFTSIVAHDMKEPLRRIQYCGCLIEENAESELDRDTYDNIKVMIKSTKTSIKLFDDFIEYCDLNKKMENNFMEIELSKIVEKVHVDLHRKGHQDEVQVHFDNLPIVFGIPSMIERVFYSLFENSLKFRKKEPPSIRLSTARDGDFWEVSVRDNGVGIDASHAERIFEVFQRLHASTDMAGTGIGLSICKRIIELHGGRIWLDADSSDGACFHFTLPAHR